MAVMSLGGVHHIKLPVTDVVTSSDWYCRVLGLEVAIRFEEEGVLMGVALSDPARTVQVALRLDPERARALAGFDPVALLVPDADQIIAWRDHLDALGEPHGGVVTGGSGGSVLVGLADPDGIEVRLYADPPAGPSDRDM